MIADILGLQPETQPLLELIMGAALVIYMGLTLYLGSHHCQEWREQRRCKKAGFLTTSYEKQQFYRARVDGCLDKIRDHVKHESSRATLPTDAALAQIFVDRFEDTFMFSRGCDDIDTGDRGWVYCYFPGVYRTSPAHVDARHACMRMIAILTPPGPATKEDRFRVESPQTVDNVLKIASWDPRLNFRPAFVTNARESHTDAPMGASR